MTNPNPSSRYNYSVIQQGTVAPRKFIQLTDVNMIGVNDKDLVSYDAATKTFVPVGVSSSSSTFESISVSGISSLGIVSATNGYFTGILTAQRLYGVFDGSIENSVNSTNTIGGIVSVSYLRVSGVSTLGNVISSGIITASTFVGTLTGIASTSLKSNYALVSGISTYATSSGVATYSNSSGIATYSQVSGISTYSTTAGVATYSSSAGIATYATSSGVSTYSSTAGVSTVAQGLTGTPNLTVGIVTATRFIGDGSGLINVPGGGGTAESYWTKNISGVSTTSNVGIGTSIPTSKLHVLGDALISGVVTATKFIGDGFGLTNLQIGIVTYAQSAGIATYSTSSGIATVSQGLTGSPNITVGIATATRFSGDGSTLININSSSIVGIISYSSSSGIATYASIAGIATVAQNLTGTPNLYVGIITATNFVGDGSGLFNVPGGGGGGTGELYWVKNLSGINTTSNVGIGTSNLTSKLHVLGDALFVGTGIVTANRFSGDGSTLINISSGSIVGIITYSSAAGIATLSQGLTGTPNLTVGIVTATNFVGSLTGTATTATKLQNIRTFQITGPITAPAQNFDGTQNVSLASTIQPDSIGLGTHTYGDYVKNITGTTGEVEVSVTSGEGVSTQIGLPNDVTISNNLNVNNDLQVNRNLNVNGNITIGGTTAFLNVNNVLVKDRDIVSGYTVDIGGNDTSTDTTANSGGIAVASTEGSPIVNLNIVGIETLPPTYKKLMWFKSGSFAGLGTDAWMFNYSVGIGSTQIPLGTRLAVGGIQLTDQDLAAVRNINASGVTTVGFITGANSYFTGIVTATKFVGDGSGLTNLQIGIVTYAQAADTATYATSSGIATVSQGLTGSPNITVGIVTATNFVGPGTFLTGVVKTTDIIPYAVSSGISTVSQGLTGSPNLTVGIVTAFNFVGNLTGTATTSITSGYASTSGISTTSLGLTGTPNLTVGIVTATRFIGDGSGLTNIPGGGGTGELYWSKNVSGVSTTSNVGIGTSIPTSRLHVLGDALFGGTGIVTATKFVGDGSGLTNIPGGGSPAGTGSELQFRSSSSAFGAVTGSSVDGSGNVVIASRLSSTVANASGFSSILLSGTWFTGGIPATTKPAFLIEPAGTTSTGWPTTGSGLGVNCPSGFTGWPFVIHQNGSLRWGFDIGTKRTYLYTDGTRGDAYFDRSGSGNDPRLVALNSTQSFQFTGMNSVSAPAFVATSTTIPGFIDNNQVSIWGQGIRMSRVGGSGAANQLIEGGSRSAVDEVGFGLTVRALPRGTVASSTPTNPSGVPLNLFGGDAFSNATNAANGGPITLDGGIGYGTGVSGNVVLCGTRGFPQIGREVTVAQLPAASATWRRSEAVVSDANLPMIGSVVTGGGSSYAKVWCNGTAWTVTGI